MMTCLGAPENLGASGEGTEVERWRCFNVVEGKAKAEGAYGSGVARGNGRGLGAPGLVMLVLVVSLVMGM